MLRSIAVAFVLSLVGVAAALAAATAYRDPDGRFTVTVPEGWIAEKPTATTIALVMIKPRDAGVGGVCMVLVLPTPQTQRTTQAELDQALSAQFTAEYWKTGYAAAGAKDVDVESVGEKEQNGRKTFFVVVSMTIVHDGTPARSKSKQVIHAIPGSLHFVDCLAKPEIFPEVAADFESIFESYVPKSGDLIARATPSAPSLLTLYSGPRFDGYARVVSQDTPDLPQQGWNGATASFAVAGFGQWEVCEGLAYSGRCGLVSGASAAGLGARVLRIGSVRRYANAGDVRGALSLISQTVGAQIKAASERSLQRGHR